MGARAAALLMTTAVATAATGCGDDNAGGAPSKAAYIKRADAICKKGNDALHAAEARFFAGKSNPSARQEQTYGTEIFVPNLEGQIAKLRQLTAPKGDENAVRAIWDAASAGLAERKANPASFGGAPSAGFKKANRLATQYGFRVCGST